MTEQEKKMGESMAKDLKVLDDADKAAVEGFMAALVMKATEGGTKE